MKRNHRKRTSPSIARAAAKRGRADRPSKDLELRGKVWVEIGGAALTDAGADLLEQIEICASLSESARRLRYSYRRAWMLVDAMNRRWPAPLVKTATGGRRGGGTRITELGCLVLRSYRDLQLRLEHLLDEEQPAFAKAARAASR
jgi:molybdate transport system regulatory protein